MNNLHTARFLFISFIITFFCTYHCLALLEEETTTTKKVVKQDFQLIMAHFDPIQLLLCHGACDCGFIYIHIHTQEECVSNARLMARPRACLVVVCVCVWCHQITPYVTGLSVCLTTSDKEITGKRRKRPMKRWWRENGKVNRGLECRKLWFWFKNLYLRFGNYKFT